MAEHGAIFGAMLQEFNVAARIINLEPGVWNILTHPKRQVIVSCPVQMDNGEIEVFTGYRVQYNITLGRAKGGIVCDPTRMSRRELEALTRRYVAEIVDLIGPEKDVPAPDVNTNDQI